MHNGDILSQRQEVDGTKVNTEKWRMTFNEYSSS